MKRLLSLGWVALVAGALAAGCAAKQGAAPMDPTQDDPARALDEVRGLASQMERHEQELKSLQAAPRPNCPRAQALAGTICKLAERICKIARRHPAQAELRQRCQDAEGSCERSRVKVAVRCPMGF